MEAMNARDEILVRSKNMDDAASRCANELASDIAALAKNQDQVVIALCGGSSPTPLYQQLAQALGTLHESARSKLRFIPLDERAVDEESDDFNLNDINSQLLHPLSKNGSVVSWQVCWYQHKESLETGLAEFNTSFENIGGAIDVVIAGSGPDGHIASLFPNHRLLLDMNSTHFLAISDSPKPPPQRITASRRLITNASICVGIFTEGKEEAYENFRATHTTIEHECPAKLLRLFSGKAAKGLKPKLYSLTTIFN